MASRRFVADFEDDDGWVKVQFIPTMRFILYVRCLTLPVTLRLITYLIDLASLPADLYSDAFELLGKILALVRPLLPRFLRPLWNSVVAKVELTPADYRQVQQFLLELARDLLGSSQASNRSPCLPPWSPRVYDLLPVGSSRLQPRGNNSREREKKKYG
ncbi:hypothetical protein KQX54_001798 [Cotesia glomerata]|uniref:Uncharacterized protein n=1 Tax=Cotesia glomerata TaxID=32391 RepID=A0AAV7HV49_COTGL|nr:hypothetical protein KQX54_001798 [Cotesia glomerata]